MPLKWDNYQTYQITNLQKTATHEPDKPWNKLISQRRWSRSRFVEQLLRYNGDLQSLAVPPSAWTTPDENSCSATDRTLRGALSPTDASAPPPSWVCNSQLHCVFVSAYAFFMFLPERCCDRWITQEDAGGRRWVHRQERRTADVSPPPHPPNGTYVA